MRTTLQRLLWIVLLLAGSLLGAATPAQAANRQIAGSATVDPALGGQCAGPPAGFEDFVDFAPLVLEGSLDGCWYTNIDSFKTTPSGVYLERGREVFVGSLDGGPVGTFTTTYRFEGKFAPDGTEIHGRCQHPLVAGSGTGGFAGVTGRVFFKDVIGDPVVYVYRGHLSFERAGSAEASAERSAGSTRTAGAAAASGGC
jgi:hypothetical protein